MLRQSSITLEENFWLLKVQILYLMASKIGLQIVGSHIYYKYFWANKNSYIDDFLNYVVAKRILDKINNIFQNFL